MKNLAMGLISLSLCFVLALAGIRAGTAWIQAERAEAEAQRVQAQAAAAQASAELARAQGERAVLEAAAAVVRAESPSPVADWLWPAALMVTALSVAAVLFLALPRHPLPTAPDAAYWRMQAQSWQYRALYLAGVLRARNAVLTVAERRALSSVEDDCGPGVWRIMNHES